MLTILLIFVQETFGREWIIFSHCHCCRSFCSNSHVRPGNHWFEEVGDCPWWHHQFPLKLLQQIVQSECCKISMLEYFWNVFEIFLKSFLKTGTGEDWVYGWLIDTGEGGSKAFWLCSIHPFEYYQWLLIGCDGGANGFNWLVGWGNQNDRNDFIIAAIT